VPLSTAIVVRRERPGDEAAIAHVNDEAFGQADEARIVAAVRQNGHATISLVAVNEEAIVGHILFTPVALEPADPAFRGLGLGPMAVVPALQRRGIGSELVTVGLVECAKAGCDVVVVVGHPEFYPRFGFRRGSAYELRSEFDVPDEVFMAAELRPGALAGRHGVVRYVSEFSQT
jgi:putative acetyltransferase